MINCYQVPRIKSLKLAFRIYLNTETQNFIPMKYLFSILVLASTYLLFSCNEHANNTKKNNDSAYSGLEGTREEASQLSNATIDTNSGQKGKKPAEVKKDSSTYKGSAPVK